MEKLKLGTYPTFEELKNTYAVELLEHLGQWLDNDTLINAMIDFIKDNDLENEFFYGEELEK